jgi:hypothetical protein
MFTYGLLLGVPISLLGIVAAFAGGFFGAMIGGLLSFVLMGFLVLAGLAVAIAGGGSECLLAAAWGPIFGPQVGLLGGAIAAAYAKWRGYVADGKQIAVPLVVIERLDVLVVGGFAGVFGYLLAALVRLVPRLGGHFDAIAVSISLTMILARLVFGRTGLLGFRASESKAGSNTESGASILADESAMQKSAASSAWNWKNLRPTKTNFWLPYQSRLSHVGVQGLVVGALAAIVTLDFMIRFPHAAGVVHEFAFAISAISLLGMLFALPMPVTHHITLPAATAVSLSFLQSSPIILIGGIPELHISVWLPLLLLGAVVGALGGLLGELFSRLWLIRGDTLIDPPTLTNAVLLTALSILLR